MKSLLILFYFLMCLPVYSQSIEDGRSELAFLADVMTNASEEKHRKFAFDEFSRKFLEKLNEEGSYAESFEQIKFISIKPAPNNDFRILTWYFKGDTLAGQYKGVIQTNLGKTFLLHDVFNGNEDYSDDFMNSESWLGAYYYNFKHINQGKQDYFLLFGIRYWNEFENIKVCEVLSFENGLPVFGKKIFTHPLKNESYTRLLFRYAKTAYFTLNFNDGMEMIVHDHLIPQMYPGADASLVPDGSLSGYEWKNGNWLYVDEIYNQTLDEAPRPKPVLDSSKKDLFGRERKQK